MLRNIGAGVAAEEAIGFFPIERLTEHIARL
jgi:hypothetical protein